MHFGQPIAPRFGYSRTLIVDRRTQVQGFRPFNSVMVAQAARHRGVASSRPQNQSNAMNSSSLFTRRRAVWTAGILAAQQLKPQAVALAEQRGIATAQVDLAVLRGEREPELTLFAL